MITLLQVALGGAIGAVLRYGTGMLAVRLAGSGFPWGTLTVNLLGSFLMGMAFAILGPRAPGGLFLMTGVLGGFTTFSAFSLETVALIERGAPGLAAAYVLASVTGGVLLLMSALWLFRAPLA